MEKDHNFRRVAAKYAYDTLAVLFIFWGVVAFLTPFTPASWLFFVGLLIIFGRKRTEAILLRVVGKRWFDKLKIGKILKKISTKMGHKT